MAFCLQAQSDTTTQDASVGPMQFPEIGLPIQFHHIRAMVCGLDSDSRSSSLMFPNMFYWVYPHETWQCGNG